MSTASQLKEIGIAEGMKKGKAEGIAEGRAEGIEKGIEKNREEIARRMLREGLEHDQVCRYTGLSLKELLKLAKER